MIIRWTGMVAALGKGPTLGTRRILPGGVSN